VASGCAARGSRFAQRFVKPGEPSLNLAATGTVPPEDTLREYARRVRTVQANARPKTTLASTIEGQNPVLAAALLKLAMHESAATHREVAAAYRAIGITDYAYRHLARAIHLEPCDAATFDALARLWRDWGMLDFALSDAHRGIYCSPGSSELYNTLGTILQELGQPRNAELAFRRAVDLNPNAAFALSNLCYVAVARADTRSARDYCGAALALDPNLTAARNNLALADAIAGDIDAAERRLMQAATTSSGYYNVGVLRLSIGKYREAAIAFDRAFAEDPSFRIARERAIQARRAADSSNEDQP
jgi:Flp pilus assembly protein TadD